MRWPLLSRTFLGLAALACAALGFVVTFCSVALISGLFTGLGGSGSICFNKENTNNKLRFTLCVISSLEAETDSLALAK
jgi:hypothetical protein